jgi:AhpD family alkylhydroperoxidase
MWWRRFLTWLALAISVAIRCSPCIAYHAEGAVGQGASRAEVAEVLSMAIYMGAGPSVMYAAQALEAVDQMAAKAAKPAWASFPQSRLPRPVRPRGIPLGAARIRRVRGIGQP